MFLLVQVMVLCNMIINIKSYIIKSTSTALFILSGVIWGQNYKITSSQITGGQAVSSSGQYSMSSTTTSQTSFPTSSDSFSVSQGMIGVIQTVNTIPPEVYFSIQDNTFNSGFPINVIGVVKDLNGIATANLHLQKGGTLEEIILPMVALNDSLYEVSIHDSLVTVNNFRAYVKGIDNLENEGNSPLFYPSIKYGANELNTKIENSGYPNGIVSKKWRMISFPGNVSDSLIKNPKDEGHVFYAWDNLENKWLLPESVEPGKAYWFKHNYDNTVPFSSDSGTAVSLQKYKINLKKGWNMIGSPFAFPVNVESDLSIVSDLYFFGDSLDRDGWVLKENIMNPWAGYAIYTDSEDASINLIPFNEDDIQRNISRKSNEDEWLILINAETKLNVDHSVMIGRRNESLDEIDNSDFPELPKIENGLSVALSHNDGNSYEFSKDLRSTNTQNGVWNISIKSKSNSGDINFSLNEIMSLPEGVVISVLDVQSRHVYENILEEFIVINKNNNLGYELKVIIGEPSYVQTKILELLTIIPSEFVLDKNFPNPFNPITKMYYTLPKRSLVSIKVYNMLGKEVVTLLEKEQSFGKYSISWNGQDNFGKQVSSGVYFAEIRASDNRRINKMLLMK